MECCITWRTQTQRSYKQLARDRTIRHTCMQLGKRKNHNRLPIRDDWYAGLPLNQQLPLFISMDLTSVSSLCAVYQLTQQASFRSAWRHWVFFRAFCDSRLFEIPARPCVSLNKSANMRDCPNGSKRSFWQKLSAHASKFIITLQHPSASLVACILSYSLTITQLNNIP